MTPPPAKPYRKPNKKPYKRPYKPLVPVKKHKHGDHQMEFEATAAVCNGCGQRWQRAKDSPWTPVGTNRD